MKFVVINPADRTIASLDAPDAHEAAHRMGLGGVDHGTVARGRKGGIAIMVPEFGLFVPPAEQHYFALNGRLYAGTSVLYGFDEAGETIDLLRSTVPDVRWFLGVNDVEAAIGRGEVPRPQMSVSGDVIWAWPSPAPAGMGK